MSRLHDRHSALVSGGGIILLWERQDGGASEEAREREIHEKLREGWEGEE